jgi:hypothetical protein
MLALSAAVNGVYAVLRRALESVGDPLPIRSDGVAGDLDGANAVDGL